MIRKFKTLEPNKQFNVLLLSYFAIPVLQSIVAIVGSFTDSLPYELQKFLNTKADWIAYGFMLCTLLVIIALLRIKEYSSNKKYMIGLTLLIVSSAISLIDDVVAIPYAIKLPLNILKVIIPFVGLILFMIGSPANRQVKLMAICSPIIKSIAASPLMFLLMSADIEDYQIYNIAFTGGIFAIQLAIFVIMLILISKQSSEQ